MKKNLLLRLCLMISAILALSSCIHDEVYSSTDPASTEYNNKTLWEQDEKYIKNVMAVYTENEKDIRKSSGVPFWDYATTINNFDESFLMVPIVENKRVVAVLQVPRKGSKVYFYYSRISEQINFFQGLIFTKHKKAVFSDNAYTNKSIICTTQTYAFWYPADESNPDPESGEGSWEPRTVVVCRELLEDCVSIVNEFGECDGGGGDDNENPGYDYPGEVEEPTQLPHPKNPCKKTKALLEDPAVKAKMDTLEKKSKTIGEKAFLYMKDNTTSAMIDGGDHEVNITPYSGYKGIYHNHTPGGTKMFSVDDIVTMYKTAVKQLDAATAKEAFIGMVVHETCNCPPDNFVYHNYLLRFNGDFPKAIALAYSTKEQIKKWNDYYYELEMNLLKNPSLRNGPSIAAKLNSQGLQQLLFGILGKMNITPDQVVLQKIEKNGIIHNINLNPDDTTTPVPCL